MIPQAYITEWANQVPWQTNEQVEQDLVICRALVEIFSDEWLASSLAFRGDTAVVARRPLSVVVMLYLQVWFLTHWIKIVRKLLGMQ